MIDQKTVDQPLSFAEVVAAERQAIRPNDVPGKPSEPLSALCISGGGIRSATFALGVLQGLAEHGILSSFDYLSTVSGGGYIGSWRTAWKQRQGGLDKIIPALRPSAPAPDQKDPDPIQHLREYNNYLSPKMGLFSADSWTLLATVVRNMLLNWLVLVPLLMFVLMAPRLMFSLARLGEALLAEHPWVRPHQIDLERLLAGLAGLALAIAACNALRYLPGVGKVNHTEIDFLKYCLTPLILAAFSFITLEAWFTGGDENGPTKLTYKGLLLGIIAAEAAGWIAYAVFNFAKVERKPRLWGWLTIAIVPAGFSTASFAWLLVDKLYLHIDWAPYVTFAPPLLLLAFALPLILFVGMTSKILEDEDREWLSRAGAWLLLFILGWAGMCSLVLLAPGLLFKLPAWGRSAFAAAGGAGGVITALGGFSPKSKSHPQNSKAETNSTLTGLIMPIAAAVFVVIFLAGLAILTNWQLSLAGLVPGGWTDHHHFVENTRTRSVVAAAAVYLAFAWVMARFVNINTFSLHAMYRDRLIRAYLGASNARGQANKFTGFTETDNFEMGSLSPSLRPFHVINITLNLVAGQRLAWQQRKAESFTVSPLHCGSSQLGYRPSGKYGDGISLGTAMALSGAAASPNMGYYSSPVIGFIMTLFNARLGAWLGNPGQLGDSSWQHAGPNSAIKSLVREAFGLTNEHCPYIYLSDGGHFENLALYEMVKRRCRYIVVLDGGADGELKFCDLGNALRKVRIDTKVDIMFYEPWAQPMHMGQKRWAVAKIHYQQAGMGEDGYLIYIKPLIRETEPPDVASYRAANPDFPHQSTANQFFNASTTESYRMLGLHTVREMCADLSPEKGFQALVDHVRDAPIAKAMPLATTV